MVRVSRRRCSILLASVLGLVAGLRPSRAWAGTDTSHDALRALLDAILSDPAGARAIGRRFLASGPDAAAGARALADRLLAERPGSPTDLRCILARRRKDDLRRRAFVLVDGWILPRLEAQVCALTVLLP